MDITQYINKTTLRYLVNRGIKSYLDQYIQKVQLLGNTEYVGKKLFWEKASPEVPQDLLDPYINYMSYIRAQCKEYSHLNEFEGRIYEHTIEYAKYGYIMKVDQEPIFIHKGVSFLDLLIKHSHVLSIYYANKSNNAWLSCDTWELITNILKQYSSGDLSKNLATENIKAILDPIYIKIKFI